MLSVCFASWDEKHFEVNSNRSSWLKLKKGTNPKRKVQITIDKDLLTLISFLIQLGKPIGEWKLRRFEEASTSAIVVDSLASLTFDSLRPHHDLHPPSLACRRIWFSIWNATVTSRFQISVCDMLDYFPVPSKQYTLATQSSTIALPSRCG